MALLLDIRQPEWMTEAELRDQLQPLLPDASIHTELDKGGMPDVTMLVVTALHPGVAPLLENLRLVQKLGAGVETIVGHPELPPSVPVARLRPEAPAREIAEYCLAYVLREQRNMRAHEADAAAPRWRPIEPKSASSTRVAVLGLGHIGARTARIFASLGFKTMGWSRSPKTIEGVECHSGTPALAAVLAEADYVVSVLPSTPQTRGLLDAERFSQMKRGAVLINVGRGDLVVDEDLLAALDGGQLGFAVLDVFHDEPLPAASPYWRRPDVTVTPHVSGWSIEGGLETVAENYRRLVEGRALLNEVDRSVGY